MAGHHVMNGPRSSLWGERRHWCRRREARGAVLLGVGAKVSADGPTLVVCLS